MIGLLTYNDSMSTSDPEGSQASEHKLPRTKARRRSNKSNDWTAADAAERRKPILALVIIGGILVVGILLMTGVISFAEPEAPATP